MKSLIKILCYLEWRQHPGCSSLCKQPWFCEQCPHVALSLFNLWLKLALNLGDASLCIASFQPGNCLTAPKQPLAGQRTDSAPDAGIHPPLIHCWLWILRKRGLIGVDVTDEVEWQQTVHCSCASRIRQRRVQTSSHNLTFSYSVIRPSCLPFYLSFSKMSLGNSERNSLYWLPECPGIYLSVVYFSQQLRLESQKNTDNTICLGLNHDPYIEYIGPQNSAFETQIITN